MDLTTVLGLIAVVLVILRAVWGDPEGVYDGLSLLVVLGGGIAATFAASPLRAFADLPRIVRSAFRWRAGSPVDLVKKIVACAETARREGILALEEAAMEMGDPFMATGIRLAVDGTEPELIQTILETELTFIEERHADGQKLVKTLGVNWAIFGVIAALLVLVLRPESAGTGFGLVSQASLPLLYGFLLAGLFSVTLRGKLEFRSREETLMKRMIMEGVMSIQSGDNPRIVEQKLNVFLAPGIRVRGEGDGADQPAQKKPRSAPAPDPEEAKREQEMADVVSGVMRRLQDHLSEAVFRAQGPLRLENVLSLLPEEERKEVLEALATEVREPEEAAPPGTFVFEDIAQLTDRETQYLLREIDTRDLVVCLKGASQAVRERMLRNMSERVGAMIKEGMASRKNVQAKDVLAVQLRVVHLVRQLQAVGRISPVR